MNLKYDAAMYIRIFGVVLSILSLSLVFIKPFEPVFNTLLIYLLLVMSALTIIIGQLVIIQIAPKEEIESIEKRHEAIYDVITTGTVVGLFVVFYVVPFLFKYYW